MGGEAMAMLKVMSWVAASMTYARFVSASVHPGKFRLLCLTPVIVLLPSLPFYFSTLHLRTISAFFLVWLAAFKLLLLAFGLGPLSPALPLPTFLAISSLPVKLRSAKTPPTNPSGLLLPSAIKAVLFYLIVSQLYQYKSRIHPYLLTTVYCLHLYLALDLVLASCALLVGVVLGLEVEPQFDAPFKADSLQDFWGRRWNLTVTGLLRPSVYHPVSARWGRTAGFLATFLVSGIMHEVMFYYLALAPPTGEVTCFFILHGICTAAEVGFKRNGWWRRRPHPALATPLAVGFVAATGLWLFLPPVLTSRADRIVVEECEALVRLLEDAGRTAVRRMGVV